MTPKARIHTWDWKEQPPWGAIQVSLIEVPLGNIHEVETNCDEFAIVVGDFETPKQAQEYFDEHRYDE